MDADSSDTAAVRPGLSESLRSAAERTRDPDADYNPPELPEDLHAGLTRLQKIVYHGSGIGVGLLLAYIGLLGWRLTGNDVVAPPPAMEQSRENVYSSPPPGGTTASTDTSAAPAEVKDAAPPRSHPHLARASAGADVIAAAKPASGLMYVHRNNSDLRPAPSTSSEPIKKLVKGEKVQLLALSDKWAEVDDGGTKGWMRASVIKDTPPGEKRARKSDSEDE